ncbi:hypothetical protein [Streptomyces atratus]
MDRPPHPVRRRALDGTFERMVRAAQAHAGEAGDIQWLVSVGSTIVRAHQHAGASRGSVTRVVERCFNRHWRGIATEYHKTAKPCRAAVTLASVLMWA